LNKNEERVSDLTGRVLMRPIQEIREDFPVTRKKTFLNHASVSPMPKPVSEAMNAYLEKRVLQEESDFDLEESRKTFSELIHAESSEIALVPNTSTGMSIAANIIEYPQGCNVVTTDLEFPSVVYPWLKESLRSRLELRYVRNVNGEIRLEDLEKTVDDKTVAVAVSHVEYANGFRNADTVRYADRHTYTIGHTDTERHAHGF